MVRVQFLITERENAVISIECCVFFFFSPSCDFKLQVQLIHLIQSLFTDSVTQLSQSNRLCTTSDMWECVWRKTLQKEWTSQFTVHSCLICCDQQVRMLSGTARPSTDHLYHMYRQKSEVRVHKITELRGDDFI